MKLERDTVKKSIITFANMYGWPNHVREERDMSSLIDGYYEALAETYSEESFGAAVSRAKHSSYGFPKIRDFHKKDGPEHELPSYVFDRG